MKILTYLYDADGTDMEIDLEENIPEKLNDNQSRFAVYVSFKLIFCLIVFDF